MQAFTHKTRIQVYGETKLLAHAHSNHGVLLICQEKHTIGLCAFHNTHTIGLHACLFAKTHLYAWTHASHCHNQHTRILCACRNPQTINAKLTEEILCKTRKNKILL